VVGTLQHTQGFDADLKPRAVNIVEGEETYKGKPSKEVPVAGMGQSATRSNLNSAGQLPCEVVPCPT
jgi:hypothetical protein